MKINSRTKGASGERELSNILSDITGWKVRRKVRNLIGESDLEIVGNDQWSIEVKRYAKIRRGDIAIFWDQCVAQAVKENRHPVLFMRQNNDEWRSIWIIDSVSNDLKWTVETSVELWCKHAAEMVKKNPPTSEG
jgi:hypothetical protein